MRAELERNRAIYEEHMKGASFKELAEKYSVSSARAKELFEREEKKENYRSNEIYILLEKFCEDEQLKTKTVSVLEREQAMNVEGFVALNVRNIKRIRNCGLKMQSVLLKILEEIEKKYVS